MPQELIAETLAVTGSFHQACNVHEIHVRRHQSFRSHNFTYSCQPGVGYRDFTNVGVDGSERVGGRFHRLPGQGAEKGGFPSVGETYYAYGERQPSLLILRPWYPPRDCLDDIVHHPASLPMTAWMTTYGFRGLTLWRGGIQMPAPCEGQQCENQGHDKGQKQPLGLRQDLPVLGVCGSSPECFA